MKEWITGRNPVYECLRAGRRHIFRMIIKQRSNTKGRIEDILKIARKKRISVGYAEKISLSNIAEHHQGIALEVSAYPYTNLREIINRVKQTEESMYILVIDQVQDIQNLGTLIRTAEIFGVHGVVIPMRRAAGITPAVVNASSGASEHLLIAQRNISQAIDELKENGAWVVGLDMDDSVESLEQIKLDGPLAVVVGSEERGLRRLVREKCDRIAYIKMRGKVASLNAAVAGSIALYKAAIDRKGIS